MSLLLYLRTLRYLRPAQVAGRIWYRLVRGRPVVMPTPRERLRVGQWRPWAWREPALLAPDRLRFLSEERCVSSALDWDDPSVPRLWRYNLHYFDDLVARESTARAAWHATLLSRWLDENPPGRGTAWEPYPTSLRIVNCVKWMLSGALESDAPLRARLTGSLATQSRWLRSRLEWHLFGNHLWANAKALIFAGAYFEGLEPDQWLADGLRLFASESEEQILSDGGHFERTPMYHAALAEDVLDLLNLAEAVPGVLPSEFVVRLRHLASGMLRWLRIMTHPDGRVAFFNDCAFGIAPEYAALAAHARALGIAVDERPLAPVEVLESSGYVRLANTRLVVLCDVARIGPDYQPAHAHADTLSFECSLDGERLLVNGGTSTYEPGAVRQRERGTAAHNTVVVDSMDSSEMWGTFRVARRARPTDVRWGMSGSQPWLMGVHDGYRRLPGRVLHERRWQLGPDALVIIDRLHGIARTAEARFHLTPHVKAAFEPGERTSSLRLQTSEGCEATLTAEPARLVLESDRWSPVFGPPQLSQTLSASFLGSEMVTRVSW